MMKAPSISLRWQLSMPPIPTAYPFNSAETCGANCDNGLTGFLEGIGELGLAEGNPTIPFKENDFDLYFQDNFKLTQHLTLNLGIRYEFFGQAINFLHNETVARQNGSAPVLEHPTAAFRHQLFPPFLTSTGT